MFLPSPTPSAIQEELASMILCLFTYSIQSKKWVKTEKIAITSCRYWQFVWRMSLPLIFWTYTCTYCCNIFFNSLELFFDLEQLTVSVLPLRRADLAHLLILLAFIYNIIRCIEFLAMTGKQKWSMEAYRHLYFVLLLMYTSIIIMNESLITTHASEISYFLPFLLPWAAFYAAAIFTPILTTLFCMSRGILCQSFLMVTMKFSNIKRLG